MRRIWHALTVLFAVSACTDGANIDFASSGARKPAETISVADGDVVIGGPPGYCVDRGSSRAGGDTPFVLLASCASIAGRPAPANTNAPGLLTASIDAPAVLALDPRDLRDFLTTDDGNAALARDGRSQSVTIISSRIDDGALFVHISDTSENPTPGLESDYWRGLFSLNDRLITVTVVGFEARPLTLDTGLNTLQRFVDRIKRETPQR